MTGTARTLTAVVALTLLTMSCGCGKPGGILLTPVSTDKRLEETTIQRDSGWVVTDKILVLDVEGMLANAEMGSFLGPKDNPVALFVEKLNKAERDKSIRAVLVRINSPGGTVAASDIMHHELMRFRQQRPDVTVVAQILAVGASGGYYLACGAERIYALPSSVTGSIGVIFQTFSLAGTLKMIGIKSEPIKSGPNKDMASPLHDLTDAERALLQKIIDEYYEAFVGVVLAGRSPHGLTRDKLLPVADGRVLTGTQAVQAGIVDDLVYPDEVIDRLKKQAGLTKVRVVMYQRPFGYKANVYSATDVPAAANGATVNLINIDLLGMLGRPHPQFLYLWARP